jgi:hypothetical protein
MSQAALHLDHPSSSPPARARVRDLISLVESEMHLVETWLAKQMDSPVGRIPEVGGHLL